MVEPKIGCLKSDHRMDQSFLSGLQGDAINAILAATGSNRRKLLNEFRDNAWRLAAALIHRLRIAVETGSITPKMGTGIV